METKKSQQVSHGGRMRRLQSRGMAALDRNAGSLQNRTHNLLSRRHSGLDVSNAIAAKQELPDEDEERVECAIYSLMTQHFYPRLQSPCQRDGTNKTAKNG